jgi:hypothetical protein
MDILDLIRKHQAQATRATFNVLKRNGWATDSPQLGETGLSAGIQFAKGTAMLIKWNGQGRVEGLAVVTVEGGRGKAAIIPGTEEGWEELAKAVEKDEFECWQRNAKALESGWEL